MLNGTHKNMMRKKVKVISSLGKLPIKTSERSRIFLGLLSLTLIIFQTIILAFSQKPVLAQTTTTKVYLAGAQSTSMLGIVGGYTVPVSVKVDNITNTTGLAAFSF